VDNQQYDLTKTPKDDAERFARFNAAFKLEYFTRSDDGTKDARLIRRSTGQVVTAPKGRKASIRIDLGFVASFYQIKLALHIGHVPRPQVDHANTDWSDHRLCNLRELPAQANQWNKRTPRKQNASLPKGAKKHKGRGKATTGYEAQARDAQGRRIYLGYFPLSKHGKPEAKRLAAEAYDAHARALHGPAYRPKRKNGGTPA
jgi:hypothetical protein